MTSYYRKYEHQQREDRIVAVLIREPLTTSAIADRFGLVRSAAYQVLRRLAQSGRIQRTKLGEYVAKGEL